VTLGVDGHWFAVRDADPRVIAMYERHYSASPEKKGKHRSGVTGPSERMVLMTTDSRALWIWRLFLPPSERVSKMVRPDQRRAKKGLGPTDKASSYFGDQAGVMCTIFRNEGPMLSSALVKEAMAMAWVRWPGQRLFTYVWDAKVESVNPGYCFKVAGWRTCGRNKDGRLTILEALP
jgi:hypothetical protein